MKDDQQWMDLALEEGRKGLGRTSPNPPVGAVIVDASGELIGKGFHRRTGEPHAEVNAIREASEARTDSLEKFTSCSLYVTLEPCSTSGRTGACTEVILKHKFARVVIGALDPNPAHAGNAIRILKNAGIEVRSGVRETEARQLIRFFAKHITTGRPWLMAKTAITLDGRTTLPPDRGPWLTGEAAREDVQRLRNEYDAILVGGETVRTDNPRLTLRGRVSTTEDRPQPWRVIVSQSGEFPQDAKVFTDDHRDRTLVFEGRSLAEVLDDLGEREICSVMMESGGRLFGDALSKNLVDEVVIYIAPILGGGTKRLLPVEDLIADLDNIEVAQFGNDVRISGNPHQLE